MEENLARSYFVNRLVLASHSKYIKLRNYEMCMTRLNGEKKSLHEHIAQSLI
jgi:hypothetical protein